MDLQQNVAEESRVNHRRKEQKTSAEPPTPDSPSVVAQAQGTSKVHPSSEVSCPKKKRNRKKKKSENSTLSFEQDTKLDKSVVETRRPLQSDTSKATEATEKSKTAKKKSSKDSRGSYTGKKEAELGTGDTLLSRSNYQQEEKSPCATKLCRNLESNQTAEGKRVGNRDPALHSEDISSKVVSSRSLVRFESSEIVQSHSILNRTTESTPWSCSSEKDVKNFFNSFGAQHNKSDLATRLLSVASDLGLSSKDTELLTSASHLGPIYSKSTITSALSVTCSSSSTQISTDRLQSSHLYGGTVLHYPSVSSDNCSSLVSAERETMKTSHPEPTDGKKSREEIEAERKARKAAKQAAKQGKGKTGVEPEPTSASSKVSVQQSSTAIGGSNTTVMNNPIHTVLPCPSNKEKKLIGGMKDLTITEQSGQHSGIKKTVDEPDFVTMRSPAMMMNHDETLEAAKAMAATASKGKVLPPKIAPTEDGGKSKAELRAERRAKQEAQRAAKASQQQEKIVQLQKQQQQKQPQQPKPKQQSAADVGLPAVPAVQVPVQSKSAARSGKEGKDASRIKLFSHIQNTFKESISCKIRINHPEHHPAIVRLGVQYAERTILGSNARCVALLHGLKEVIEDYKTPPQKEFSRGLEGHLQANVEFLQDCRPLSVSMNNALRHIKRQMTQLPNNVSDNEARRKLQEAIDVYIHQEIEKAAQAIGITVKDKITDGDVILVYACSSLVLHAVSVAHKEGRQFRVVVVDSLPWLEGREMLRRLVSLGLRCSYVHISAASFVMREVTKVLLGAHALLANGYVMSRAGSSQIALLAHTYNVPVLVCCETHKFSERVQTDSFVYNELGNPDELVGARRASEREAERERPLANWRDIANLSLLNLVYDVTPPDLVTAVVTERAILPCTSVPVILRIKPTEC